ncbi:DNA methyltransferase [Methanoculleus thermophilus]|uniref:DNA methylase n=1 Tax=Methanoculleus thermophilus TaxID=2200 RepID=A0A1G9CCL8_9EURY|nr:DNA methyltransferase [Methanoculleus thermophilus]SDK49428.1 DNA methylase [Methanoculleus thermophilus]
MTDYKLTEERLDAVRKVEGFPRGKDKDIIALSDPPYYTACPNPWIGEFIEKHGRPFDPEEKYDCEPFAADVSEGKNDPIYNAHSYHTKVPHKAIMRYILHYTKPGDIVFDGFCGTGMTGVAAQMCGNPDAEFKEKVEREMPDVVWGARRAILCDLSPAATFIAYNYNNPVDPAAFEREAKAILAEVEKECGWMYETDHVVDGKVQVRKDVDGTTTPVKGRINYTVWSDVFVCPSCSEEIVFWEAAVDHANGKVRDEFPCPHCGATTTKRSLERAWEYVHDEALRETVRRAKQVPVLINYSVGKKRFEKVPDAADLDLLDRIEMKAIPYWYPTDELPDGYNTEQPKKSHGVTHVHQFYTKRNLWVLASFISKAFDRRLEPELFLLSSLHLHVNRMRRYQPVKPGGTPGLPGTLYISAISVELPIFDVYPRKLRDVKKAFDNRSNGNVIVNTCSGSSLPHIPDCSIDYIFTDPPFGGNLMYSELNFLWEAWLRVFTNNQSEAIVNDVQHKALPEYQALMEQCFAENYRILKPGRWMTVEFHNSQNKVWMAIQQALTRAGFVIADVRVLDKKQGTFKQVTTTSAVKQDLIISAYKPNGGLEEQFKLTAGTEEGVWDFVRQHLKHLPVAPEKDGVLQYVPERQKHLLYDRMVAFHVQRGIIVPISAPDFYFGLYQRFPERDGMYFLPDQVPRYEQKRLVADRVEQMSLFVHDEKSAIQWLRQHLTAAPKTYQEIQPAFMIESRNTDKHESLPELGDLLEQNFLKDKDGRWYVPDPNKESDLEKIREKALLKEFAAYLATSGKLKTFRTEAVRAGFKQCWSERDYATIIRTGDRLPASILQEDDVLLMYYDNARTRQGQTEHGRGTGRQVALEL